MLAKGLSSWGAVGIARRATKASDRDDFEVRQILRSSFKLDGRNAVARTFISNGISARYEFDFEL